MNFKWGIFVADLNPVRGSEQKGSRLVLVISDEDFNKPMPVVTVLPMTSLKEGRRVYPNEVLFKKSIIAELDADSIVLAHQIRTIAKSRLKKFVGSVMDKLLREAVNEALRVHLNL